MYAIDLFCGAGGMSEGILQAGFHILFSSDINESVELTYRNRHEQLGYQQNYNTYFERADIRELNGDYIIHCIQNLEFWNAENREIPNDIDVIFGGPPCQGFSLAGRRNADDPRNMLFREYIRVIGQIRPRYVVMENVTGFMNTVLDGFQSNIDDEVYSDEVAPNILTQELNKIGYNVLEPRILDASDFGVPQARRRAIFIAYRDGEREPEYPTSNNTDVVTITDAIGDLIQDNDLRNNINPHHTIYQIQSINGRTPDINGNTIPSNIILNNELSRHSNLIKERFSLYNEGESTANLRDRIRLEGINLNNCINLISNISNKFDLSEGEVIENFLNGDISENMLNELLTRKNMRRRLNRNDVSSTIVSMPDDFISPFENRIFSVREMARLQSFDDSFEFLGPRTTGGERRRKEVPQYTQVGNAVPPLLARAVALKIIEVL